MDRTEVSGDLCFFCNPSTDREILLETNDLYVIPSLGHFVPGYLLIVFKDHQDCFADVIKERHIKTKRTVRNVLEQEYGACCFFEHGRIGSCFDRGNHKICYHAHLHCLPIKADFTELLEADYTSKPVNIWTDIAEYREEYPHYFYTEMDSESAQYFIVDDNPERQYLRKQACKAIGAPVEDANWKQRPYKERMEKTAARLQGTFS